MALSRADIVDKQFVDRVISLEATEIRSDFDSPVREGATLTSRQSLGIFETHA